jgi:hypothetical protein
MNMQEKVFTYGFYPPKSSRDFGNMERELISSFSSCYQDRNTALSCRHWLIWSHFTFLRDTSESVRDIVSAPTANFEDDDGYLKELTIALVGITDKDARGLNASCSNGLSILIFVGHLFGVRKPRRGLWNSFNYSVSCSLSHSVGQSFREIVNCDTRVLFEVTEFVLLQTD